MCKHEKITKQHIVHIYVQYRTHAILYVECALKYLHTKLQTIKMLEMTIISLEIDIYVYLAQLEPDIKGGFTCFSPIVVLSSENFSQYFFRFNGKSCYCVSKKQLPILYSKLLCKMGHYFFGHKDRLILLNHNSTWHKYNKYV